jgi:hypothetical protein
MDKGVTTIIAIILAVAITMAVALSAFTFVQRTERAALGQTEASTTVLEQRFSTCARLTDTAFLADNTLQMTIKNCGFRVYTPENNFIVKLSFADGNVCTFLLSSNNCDACNQTIGVGASAILNVNTTKVTC